MSTNKHDDGLRLRKEVLGEDYVGKALGNATDFDQPLQTLLTENCWGEVWSRDGISLQTRSLITIAILASMRASQELQVHVRGALNNGCTVQEIREVLLHATVYCGAPVGIEAFRAARAVIDGLPGDAT
ncbi:MAG: carboxymuconolactone decarboxylase family protein [Gammaproteobacteria bacterium]|nr:carboxymuconolactone decarboxylase family protein [Gammaproteobacteria bacterium]